jgi:hypothetical protein
MMFLETIVLKRRSFITNITLWYVHACKQGNMSFFDFAILQLRNLASLEKLKIMLDETSATWIARDNTVPGEQHLKVMSEAGVEVSFRCPEGDAILWYNFDDEGTRIYSGAPYRQYNVTKANRMVEGAKMAERRVVRKPAKMKESSKSEKRV